MTVAKKIHKIDNDLRNKQTDKQGQSVHNRYTAVIIVLWSMCIKQTNNIV